MKRFLAIIFSLFTIGTSLAQEKSIEIKINGEAASSEFLWKVVLLIIFTLAILVLVVRTFRGKPNV